MSIRVEKTDDPAQAFRTCRDHLLARPVEHNLALTILHERMARPHPGHYWWALDGDQVRGYAWRSPTTFIAGLTPMPVEAARALAATISQDAPDLPGLVAEAATAAAFAGAWTELRATGASPSEGQRIYQLDRVEPLPVPRGHLRVAERADGDLLISWMHAFGAETGGGGGTPDLEATVRRRIDDGLLSVWDDDGPAATAMVAPPVAGACRVGFVYTDPARRRRGYAQALVAAVSEQALAGGATTCLLYTQLANATSNSIYRRIGYRAVGEVLRYSFAAR